jgi:hypothetical protein
LAQPIQLESSSLPCLADWFWMSRRVSRLSADFQILKLQKFDPRHRAVSSIPAAGDQSPCDSDHVEYLFANKEIATK